MNGQVFRRRAAEFARLADLAVDRPGAEVARHLARDADATRLVTLTRALRELPVEAGPDPDFRERLRRRLVAVATVHPPAPGQRRAGAHRAAAAAGSSAGAGRPRSPWLAYLASAMATLVLVTGLAVLASTRALPGDTLYAVKRSSEHVELALVHDPEERGLRQLSFAQTRLAEIDQMLARDRGISLGPRTRAVAAGGMLPQASAGLVMRALADMDTETREGATLVAGYAVQHRSDRPLATLAGWTAAQRATLSGMLRRLPGAAGERAAESMLLLDRLSKRVDALRGMLRCACLDGAGGDDLGPLPCSPCQLTPGLCPQCEPNPAPAPQRGSTSPNPPPVMSGPPGEPADGARTSPPPPSTTPPSTPTTSAPALPVPLPTQAPASPTPVPTATGILCRVLGPIIC